ncbi:Foldase protein PrsA [uncultured archaeon]|nr:Foldase protein PrsA [uncultured archaeon]
MEVRASHILVSSEAEAVSLTKKLAAGSKFEDLARQFSKCPSSAKGGDLGFFGKGMMVKEFEAAAFSLPVGQVSPPVKTQFGYHLIKVTGKK